MDDQGFEAIAGWISALATLVAGRISPEEIRLRSGAYVSLLAEEYPSVEKYFTHQSLRYVARHSKWFPSYSELCELLSAAWKDTLPQYPAIGHDVVAREAAEPYPIQPAPEWCFERFSRHFDGRNVVQARGPVRTVEEQLAALGEAA